jgi:hypothetical protein
VLLAPWLRAPAPGHWPRLVAVALLNGSLHFGINFWALQAAGDISSVAIGSRATCRSSRAAVEAVEEPQPSRSHQILELGSKILVDSGIIAKILGATAHGLPAVG